MNIALTPELEKVVTDKITSGRYTSASEAVREALRLLEHEEKSRKEQLEEFNRELQARIDSLDRGENVTSEEFRRYFAEKSARRMAELKNRERRS